MLLLSLSALACLPVARGAAGAANAGHGVDADDFLGLVQTPASGWHRARRAPARHGVLATSLLQTSEVVRSAPRSGLETGRGSFPRAGFYWILCTLLVLPLVCFTVLGTQSGRARKPDAAAEACAALAGTCAAPAADAAEQAAVLAEFAQDLAQLKWTVVTVALCHTSMSFCTCVIGAAMLRIKEDPLFAPVDGFTEGAVVSVMLVAAAVGALCSFAVADRCGRRPAVLCVASLIFAGCIVMASARGVLQLMAGRALAGLGVGLSSCVTNLYIAEVSPAEVRGRFGAWAPLMGQTGILVAFVFPCVCLPLGGWTWRAMLGLATVPSGLVLLLSGRLPETPAWLVAQGRSDEAIAALSRLFPNVSDEALQVEVRLLVEADRALPVGSAGLLGFIWEHARALRAGVTINVLQQITGINVILYFGPQVLKIAGASDAQALLGLATINACLIVVVLGFSSVADAWGRRRVAILGSLTTMVGLAMLSTGFFLRARGWHVLDKVFALLGMVWFRWTFAFSLAPLPYVMTVELLPQEARAVGAGLSWATNWACNFVVCQSFPMLLARSQEVLGEDMAASAIFLMYLVLTAAALCAVIVVLPETAGVRLGQVKT